MSDPFAAGAQPTCLNCSVTMRPTSTGDVCPECGRVEPYAAVERPVDDVPGPPGF